MTKQILMKSCKMRRSNTTEMPVERMRINCENDLEEKRPDLRECFESTSQVPL